SSPASPSRPGTACCWCWPPPTAIRPGSPIRIVWTSGGRTTRTSPLATASPRASAGRVAAQRRSEHRDGFADVVRQGGADAVRRLRDQLARVLRRCAPIADAERRPRALEVLDREAECILCARIQQTRGAVRHIRQVAERVVDFDLGEPQQLVLDVGGAIV